MPKTKKIYPFKNKQSLHDYPFPSYKNPIILSRSLLFGTVQVVPQPVRDQLKEIEKRIMANKKDFQRKNDKIPALWFFLPEAMLPKPFLSSWCFECFVFIREALRHGVIKNRNDARFWGLKEKKALCGDCLAKRLGEMTPQKRHLWAEYQKRGYWRIN